MPQEQVRWNDPKTSRYLNKRIPRVDGPDKVTGAAKYTYDIALPGMLYGKILRCPHANARVESIDVSAAKAMPGVRAIIDDISKTARFAGQEIAAVAADTEEIARDAIHAIRVTYDVQPHVVNTRAGRNDPDRVGDPAELSEGADPSTLWSQAAAVIEAEYYVPVREHLSLETHGIVFRWDGDDKATAWVSTQAVHGVAGGLANALRIQRQDLTVICNHMGGGFGSKFSAGTEGSVCGRLARLAGKPVKLMLDRYEEQVATGNGPDALMQCKAAMTADGKLLAIEADLWGTNGPGKRWGVAFPYRTVYNLPNIRTRSHGVSTNTGGARALRAPGHPQGNFLTETVLDELAAKVGLDPLEVRKKNVLRAVWREQLDAGAKGIGWERRNKTPGAVSGRYLRGMGCACNTWGGGGRGGSRCDVRIGSDGSVWVGIGTQDLGTGTRTYVAAIVAEDLGLPIERVHAEIGSSKLGQSGGSGGSVTTASVAPAVKMAALAARARLFEVAAPMLGVSAGDLECADGRVQARRNPSNSLSFEQVCAKLPPGGIEERGEWNRSLQQSGVAGAQFVEVEVDTWTGNVRPIKVVAVQDCGYALNRLAVESQIIGGVIQGLSMALFEDRKMDDPTGRMLNPDMENYKVLGALEVPEIVPIVFETHDKVTGLGEPPVIPTAAATGNAVFNATGIRIRTLPITPRRWFDALEEQS
ncbi:MAG: xanthine dehydrogenase family protein molybdopterin-binding subunit [Armatimonadetes bacterium]|nr:xanthine dehydrogenase family protein molybdopterin-binding subunit [Armatimonadota bacterium]